MVKQSKAFDPFDITNIRLLLKPNESDRRRLTARENNVLEFKQSFNWSNKSDYAKTMAAFANARGGYIVFGVKNNPREIVGLQNTRFEDTDPAIITEFLNTAFSPEIHWDKRQYTAQKMKIGVMYVFEAESKPVVCMKNDGDLKEADIYYRYRARSERIKYAELRTLLEQEREREKRFWADHVERIAKIGITNVGIFDSIKGTVSGPGGSFLISEEILPKLKFIKEGHFAEAAGAPALKLVGDIQVISKDAVQPVQEVVQHRIVTSSDVVYALLERQKVKQPLEFIKAICFANSGFLPIYYFVNLSQTPIAQILKEIESLESRTAAKDKLVERLSGQESLQSGSLNADTPAARKRKKYFEQLKSKTVPNSIPEADLFHFCEAVTHLAKKDIDWDYISALLKELYKNRYKKSSSNIAGAMRKAICHLDILFYQRDARSIK